MTKLGKTPFQVYLNIRSSTCSNESKELHQVEYLQLILELTPKSPGSASQVWMHVKFRAWNLAGLTKAEEICRQTLATQFSAHYPLNGRERRAPSRAFHTVIFSFVRFLFGINLQLLEECSTHKLRTVRPRWVPGSLTDHPRAMPSRLNPAGLPRS